MSRPFEETQWGSDREHWTVAGARSAGSSHYKDGKPCQDQIAWTRLSDETVFLAAADGAGSAEHAEIGAAIAVGTVVRVAELVWERPSLRGNILRGTTALFRAAALSVRWEAERLSVSSRSLATTLTVVVIGLLEASVGRVGDGLIALENSEGIHSPIEHLPREYANEANFVTDKDWQSSLQISIVDARNVTGVSLSSDGLRLVACTDTRTGSPYAPFYEDIFEAIRTGVREPQLMAFLERVDDRTGDDKSLLVAIRG